MLVAKRSLNHSGNSPLSQLFPTTGPFRGRFGSTKTTCRYAVTSLGPGSSGSAALSNRAFLCDPNCCKARRALQYAPVSLFTSALEYQAR
jgi:hypothetical protein